MKFSTKITSAVAAASAAALGAGLLAFTPGLSAAFSSSATADASISVGAFDCQLASDDPNVRVHNSSGKHTATITLDKIQSSAAGSSNAELSVINKGSIPILATWSKQRLNGSTLGAKFTDIAAPDRAVLSASGGSQDVIVGFTWIELNNDDLGHSGTVQYAVDCREAAPENLLGFAIYNWQNTAESSWDGSILKLWIPSGGGGTGINLISPSADLPDREPMLVSDYWNPAHPGSLRFTIDFADGSYIRGSQNLGYWTAVKGTANSVPTGHLSWTDVYDHYKDIDVTHVQVTVDNNWNGIPANVNCVNYSGTPLFGNC